MESIDVKKLGRILVIVGVAIAAAFFAIGLYSVTTRIAETRAMDKLREEYALQEQKRKEAEQAVKTTKVQQAMLQMRVNPEAVQYLRDVYNFTDAEIIELIVSDPDTLYDIKIMLREQKEK
jgi:predicted membrane protein